MLEKARGMCMGGALGLVGAGGTVIVAGGMMVCTGCM